MHEYDVALKRILTRPGSALLEALTGLARLRWLNVELPRVNNLRVDLLGEGRKRTLFQIEAQSRNYTYLVIRMGEYLLRDYPQVRAGSNSDCAVRGPRRMRMKDRIEGPNLSYRFHLVDIRDLDGERLLASANKGSAASRPGSASGWKACGRSNSRPRACVCLTPVRSTIFFPIKGRRWAGPSV